MINLDIELKIDFLWGDGAFKKTSWQPVNYIVGPNGTGKSVIAEKIKTLVNNLGYKTRILTAERLYGLETKYYTFVSNRNRNGLNINDFENLKSNAEIFGIAIDAFILLKERLDIRIRIEATLSDLFNKKIKLVEEGGFLKPKIQSLHNGKEYSLDESECHGLKELITILTVLYDDSYKCLILDEPEQHLHPQYQSFLLGEIRKQAGDPQIPNKKFFFVVTHSPYFLELKTIDDLKSVLVCHYNDIPSYVNQFNPDAEFSIKKFLSRLNTHHKQFFFSPNPVFVEGYTDQQLLNLLLDKLDKNITASGSCVIDVGGKEELEVFYKVCRDLRIKGRFIADLDAFFKGKLRQTISDDPTAQEHIRKSGIHTDLMKAIGDIESKLKVLADEIMKMVAANKVISDLADTLRKYPKSEDLHKVRCIALMGVLKQPELVALLPENLVSEIDFIKARFHKLLETFEECRVFILEQGTIEHYYYKVKVNYLELGSKDQLFAQEKEYILSNQNKIELEANYSGLLQVIMKVVPNHTINLLHHLRFTLLDWIHCVQMGIERKEINSIEQLKENVSVEYSLHNQIFDILSLDIPDNKDSKDSKNNRAFVCKLKLKKSIDLQESEIMFTEQTVPNTFKM